MVKRLILTTTTVWKFDSATRKDRGWTGNGTHLGADFVKTCGDGCGGRITSEHVTLEHPRVFVPCHVGKVPEDTPNTDYRTASHCLAMTSSVFDNGYPCCWMAMIDQQVTSKLTNIITCSRWMVLKLFTPPQNILASSSTTQWTTLRYSSGGRDFIPKMSTENHKLLYHYVPFEH